MALARILLISVLFQIVFGAPEAISKDLKVLNVEKSVDMTSQLLKASHKITLENSGSGGIKSFLFSVEPDIAKKLSFIGASASDTYKTPLKVIPITLSSHKDEKFWKIELKDDIQSGKSVVVEVEYVVTHHLKPHPKEIMQKEKQLVLFKGNYYVYSPYTIAKQTTTIVVGTKNVESLGKIKPTSTSENGMVYGPFENIAPFSISPLDIHYENNSPFLVITKLERTIEVSHWGNIAVEEVFNLYHTGAILKGSFSRYEYQRESQSGLSSVKSFKTLLPASATDVYYRDQIGNISTSHMRILSDSVELDVRPRFPLFGGWKTHYTIGYNVPSYEYLFNSGDDYLLRMRILDHAFDDMVVDELITKVILPEGTHGFVLKTPFDVERLPDSVHHTYLDTKGHVVINMRKLNLVENHIQDFELQYQFPRILMLQEPLLVVMAFYFLFLLVIIYVRLDFSITKDEASENKMRVAGYCEKILAHQDQRALSYQRYDEQLAKLKSSKDVNAFQAAMKSINQDYKNETANIGDLIIKIKSDAPELADKVSEIQKIDRNLKELYKQQQAFYTDKLGPGKNVPRQQLLETENQMNKKKEECIEKINALVKSLQ
ncbi:dolichyl-diphosphooligosaccharide--protein glycosyltransferase subunit 1 [Ischnura elegans]|uniref:dolichyl-diphosphooligosaccharide--protein glycosyltransferase subunit 1 n=1 Tax=Ischnura elegans TaxID=197161 RepID=UPI001ED8AA75|nr:dolichyl-diphosphooligosaccharide--protein glycosyltransferase subunit 1 [Ischnura elegans]